MKKSIFLGLLLALCLLLYPSQATTLTYIVERQIDQEDQYVELTLKVMADGRSLADNIQRAASVIERITTVVTKDCEQTAAKKSQAKKCKELVEVSKYEVEPKYHMVRKIPTFTLFILTHELTLQLKNIKTLGKLIDQINQEGDGLVTLQDFLWKTEKEVDPEVKTLKDGLEEGRELCQKIGKSLQQVLSVEELQPKEQQEEEQVKDEDLTEPEIEVTIFKFKVRCGETSPSKKTKQK